MIDNDSSKSTRCITKDMGASDFLIWQLVYEDIWHWLYQMRKGQLFSKPMNLKRKDCAGKLLNKLKHPQSESALVFLKWEEFLEESDGKIVELLLVNSVPKRCTDIDEKQALSLPHGVCGSN